jgi:cell division protein DivIC
MAKSKAKTKRRRRMLFLGLTSIVVIVATTFTIGKYWIEIYEKYQEKDQLEKELVSLKNKEKELKVDANKLQDPDYIARYAREKYLYSKDGEFILKIPEE